MFEKKLMLNYLWNLGTEGMHLTPHQLKNSGKMLLYELQKYSSNY